MARTFVELALSAADVERFWKRAVVPDNPAECWSWRGYINPAGYGYVQACGNSRPAHRVSYVIAHGPIPADMVLDHLCRNRGCCNPDHVEPVSNTENLVRSELTLPGHHLRQETCPRGHEYDGVAGRSGHRRCRTCHRAADARYKARKRAA